MVSDEGLRVGGVVREALPNASYKVELDNGQMVVAAIAGAMRMSFVRIGPGDRVAVDLSPYDMRRGRIVFRGQ